MEALTGTSLTEDHIVKPGHRPAAWYIGDVVSTSRLSAIAVMRDLVEHLSANLLPDTPVYARGLTQKGLGYLRDFRFEAVGNHRLELGRICRLLGSDVQELLSRLQSARPRRARVRKKSTKVAAPMVKKDELARPVIGDSVAPVPDGQSLVCPEER